MNQALEIGVLSGLGAAALGLLSYWSAVGYHIGRSMAVVPTAARGLKLDPGDPAALPRVCVLVPAHNEEACIATVAESLVRQDYPADKLRLVFVLDRCTDRTREILDRTLAAAGGGASANAEVMELTACAEGWVGKTHALWSGVNRSEGASNADLLLFVDADTRLDHRLVRASVALMKERRLGLLSLLSTMTYDHWFEKTIQPAAGMELMRQYPIVKANSGESSERGEGGSRRRPFANGQFILIGRKEYFAIGGHEAVKTAVLEDVEISRAAAQAGIRSGFFLDGGLLECRMYDSYAALKRGWKRIYGESTNRKPDRLRKLSRRVRLIGTVLPTLALAGVGAAWMFAGGEHAGAARLVSISSAAALVVWLAVVAWTHIIGRVPLAWVPAFPIGSWIVGGIMREAARDLEQGKPTEWGGMQISRETR